MSIKKTLKDISILIIGLILLGATLTGALAQEEVDVVSELPDAGVTPLDSKVLWKIDMWMEKVTDYYHNYVTRDPVKLNSHRIKMAEERLAEYGIVVLQNEELANEVMDEAVMLEENLVKIEETKESISKHIAVLNRVRLRLQEREINLQGIDNAIESSSKVLDKEKEPEQIVRRTGNVPKIARAMGLI